MDKVSFKDYKVMGIDSEKSYRPDENQPEYNLYFKLSGFPPFDWRRLFEQRHKESNYVPWRKAWVDNNYIIFRSPLEEMEKKNFATLQKEVADTNAAYREFLTTPEANKLPEKVTEQDVVEELGKRLKF